MNHLVQPSGVILFQPLTEGGGNRGITVIVSKHSILEYAIFGGPQGGGRQNHRQSQNNTGTVIDR